MSKAFSRITAFMAAFSQLTKIEQMAADPYRSRGHGRNKYSGRKQANPLGKYMPHQAEKEKARRVAQAGKGYGCPVFLATSLCPPRPDVARQVPPHRSGGGLPAFDRQWQMKAVYITAKGW